MKVYTGGTMKVYTGGGLMTYSGGGILTHHGNGRLAPPRYNAHDRRSGRVVNSYGLSPNYHGGGFNIGRWVKKESHAAGAWTKKADKTVDNFVKKEAPAVLKVGENAGKGALRSLAGAVPAALMGNYPAAAAMLAGGAVQGAVAGGGYGSHARAPKRLKTY